MVVKISQFHHNFKSRFCDDILAQKIHTQTVTGKMLRKVLLYKKRAR